MTMYLILIPKDFEIAEAETFIRKLKGTILIGVYNREYIEYLQRIKGIAGVSFMTENVSIGLQYKSMMQMGLQRFGPEAFTIVNLAWPDYANIPEYVSQTVEKLDATENLILRSVGFDMDEEDSGVRVVWCRVVIGNTFADAHDAYVIGAAPEGVYIDEVDEATKEKAFEDYGDLYAISGNGPMAVQYYNCAYAHVPLDDLRYKIIVAGNLRGKDIIAELTELIERNPEKPTYYGAMAVAYHADEDFTAADEWFIKAIEVDDTNVTNLINYAVHLRSQDREIEAQKYIDKAAEIDSASGKSTIVGKSVRAIDVMGPTDISGLRLGVAAIVKDEEEYVEQLVRQHIPHLHRMVVVDTGSTDKTMDILLRLKNDPEIGDKLIVTQKDMVEDFDEDFAKARNYAQSLIDDMVDWHLCVDADETISNEDMQALRHLCARVLEHESVYQIQTANYYRGRGAARWLPTDPKYSEFYTKGCPGYAVSTKTRLYPAQKGLMWRFPYHELIDPHALEMGMRVLQVVDVLVHHYGKIRDTERMKGKGDQSIRVGQKKVEGDPENAKACFELALQYMEFKNDVSSAQEQLEKAIALKPDYADAWYNYGITLIRQDRVQEAIVALETTIELNPKLGDAYLALANIVIDSNPTKAEKLFLKAAELLPYMPQIYNNLGLIAMHREDWEKARGYYEQTLELEPDAIEPHLNLAAYYMDHHNNAEKALHHLETAYAIAPNDSLVLVNLSTLMVRQGNLERAFELLGRAIEDVIDDPMLRRRYVEAALLCGRVDEVRALIQDVIDNSTDEFDAVVLQLKVDIADKNYAIAEGRIKEYKKMHKRGDDLQALLLRAIEAEIDYERRDGESSITNMVMMALMHTKQKVNFKVDHLLEQIYAFPEDRIDYTEWHNLGLIHEERYEIEEAKRCFLRAAEMTDIPEPEMVALNIKDYASFLHRQEMNQEAYEWYERFYNTITKDDKAVLWNLGLLAFQQLDKFAAAREWLNKFEELIETDEEKKRLAEARRRLDHRENRSTSLSDEHTGQESSD